MKNQLKQPQTYTFMDWVMNDIASKLRVNGVKEINKHEDRVTFREEGKLYEIRCKEVSR